LTPFFDLLVIGGGVNGAAVARDAAGRGLKTMLAERGDYASGASSASSGLIHGGLRYLETFDLRLVRESLSERAGLLKTAPHLVVPLRFLMPLYRDGPRPGWLARLGLALYDGLSLGGGLPRSARLSRHEQAAIPRLRRENLASVLSYWDAQTDDARLVMANLLDARARGADVLNRRAVVNIVPQTDGYRVTLEERGSRREIGARFVVNAAGPWADRVDALSSAPPPARKLRLVRGSHIVLQMPEPPARDAFTLQNGDGRVVFVLPWQDACFLVVGTTDVLQTAPPEDARCSDEERDYLLAAYNAHFAHPGSPAGAAHIVHTWSGVRALADDGAERASKVTREAELSTRPQGAGGMVTLYGGKLTTHRVLAEETMAALAKLGARLGARWTKGAKLHGGALPRDALLDRAARGPDEIPAATRRRWALTYGSEIDALFARIVAAPALARQIAPGVHEAELAHGREVDDAICAEDFLRRRTKLGLFADATGRRAVADWFGN
jgi:glycerol-3-phosphate dehydrogenase